MADNKKPENSKKPVNERAEPNVRKESGIAILNGEYVSNTRPAPPNPRRDNGGSEKEDKG